MSGEPNSLDDRRKAALYRPSRRGMSIGFRLKLALAAMAAIGIVAATTAVLVFLRYGSVVEEIAVTETNRQADVARFAQIATGIAAARLAGAEEFISRMPLGYDTVIEERGANLSGGQRQRIAIARALATRPRILILDEATSALDYESEQAVQANMRTITRGRTVIIIAHRLAAVRNCDRIIAIADGQIVEDGTHEELLAKADGVYAKLYRMQSHPINAA